MKCRMMTTVAIVSALMVFPLAAKQKHSREERRDHARRIARYLELNEEQREKMVALKKEMFQTHKKHFETIKDIRKQIKAEFLKEHPSGKVLDELADKQGKVHVAMEKQRMEHMLKVKEVLTGEQFEKLVERDWKEHRPPGHRDHDKHHGSKHKKGSCDNEGDAGD